MQKMRPTQDRAVQYQNLLKLLGAHSPRSGENGPTLQATRMRSIVNTHRLTQAYKEESKVAYVSEQFPTEIVFAMGVIPWNIESMAILLAQSVEVNDVFQLTQQLELSRDICSFLRGPYGMMMTDCYPAPNIVLTNDQPCEGLQKLGFASGKSYSVPTYSLHTPNSLDEESLDYLVKQLQRLMSWIGDQFGVAPDLHSLASVVEYSNEAREYFCKTVELLKTHKLQGVSRELQEIFGMNYFGTKENAKICKTLYEEALILADENPDRKKRVLWIGQVPEESHELLVHMNRSVEVVYWAPLWHANAMMLDEERPLRSVAERAVHYHWNAGRMTEDTAEICDAHDIQGLMIGNVWGCRNMMGVTPALRELAANKGLTYLTINLDLVDKNNYAFNHVKNRVDAFLELME